MRSEISTWWVVLAVTFGILYEEKNFWIVNPIYGTCVFRIYIHPAPFVRDAIFPHCMLVHGSCNHCCSRDKTNKTERLNSGNQRNRNLKTVRKGRHYYQDGG